MNDIVESLVDVVSSACRRHGNDQGLAVSEPGGWNAQLWSVLDEMGVTALSVPLDAGGAGGDLTASVEILRTLGSHCAAVPFAETDLLAGWLLTHHGAEMPTGPLTAAVAPDTFEMVQDGDSWKVSGVLSRVPWARHAGYVAVQSQSPAGDSVVVLLEPIETELRFGLNLAGEPRDTVVVDASSIPAERVFSIVDDASRIGEEFHCRGALARSALCVGAMERALEMTLAYASQRNQFGRPLSAFQLVQDHIAAIAGETLLAKVSVQAAAATVEGGGDAVLAAAIVKTLVGEAAGIVSAAAHQVHGAIGFTEEHTLRHTTTRLWAWREEFGNDGEWADRLGGRVLALGGDELWPMLTKT